MYCVLRKDFSNWESQAGINKISAAKNNIKSIRNFARFPSAFKIATLVTFRFPAPDLGLIV